MSARRRLLSIGHSYALKVNRELAFQMSIAGKDRWEVTAVAPAYFHGRRDLRPLVASIDADEPISVEVVAARLTKHVHFFYYSKKLNAVLDRGWDIVHCWEEPYIVVGGQIARLCNKRHIPYVFWTAQNIAKNYVFPFNAIEKYCVEHCAGWLGSGETVIQTQTRRGYAQRPHQVAPLAVDLNLFSPSVEQRNATRTLLNWDDPGPPVIGFLGRFLPDKGVRILTDALDGMKEPWRALFVGAGPLEGELREWAARHGDRVRIANNVLHTVVPQYLNAMDILAAPSQSTPRWIEQFGRMLIEGFACGLSVVGSDSGEIPYTIGDAGTVLPEADITAWTNALDQLVADPELRKQQSELGLERVRRNYGWPAVASQYLAFFEQRLDSQSARTKR